MNCYRYPSVHTHTHTTEKKKSTCKQWFYSIHFTKAFSLKTHACTPKKKRVFVSRDSVQFISQKPFFWRKLSSSIWVTELLRSSTCILICHSFLIEIHLSTLTTIRTSSHLITYWCLPNFWIRIQFYNLSFLVLPNTNHPS